MRTPLKSIARAALTRPLPILLILLIGGIGVQTIISCTTNIEMPPPPLPSSSSSLGEVGGDSSSSSSLGNDGSSSSSAFLPPSSSSADEQKSYCIYPEIQQCYYGTYSVCPGTGGILGNSCPYSSSSAVAASSSSLGGSSSSVAVPSSSSLAPPPSSSAAAPSSSGGCISSGSYCNYGGCSQWDSDGWTCLRHTSGWANEGGCYPMPTDDDCLSGTLVSVCPANAIPPAANYCELPPVGSPSSSSVPSSSSASLSGIGGTFTDSRDGKVYKWVKIGEQVWMSKNLDCNVEGSKCYNNQESNCTTYGRLYNWSTAMTVCPSGWHLPSGADWNALMKFVNPSCSDNSSCAGAGTKLKSASDWNSYSGVPAGTDDYGFSALPGGYGNSDGSFHSVGYYGNWWSSSEDDGNIAYIRLMGYDIEYADWGNRDESLLFSVRCLQD